MNLRLVSAVATLPMALLALSLCACIARSTPPDKLPGAVPAPAPPDQPTSPAQPAPVATAESPLALLGYIPMHASAVVPTHDGEVVVLVDEKEAVALPIFIGSTEATSIRWRLDKRRFERPLTHDLFDALMREVGAQLVKAQVDDLKNGTFVGSIFVRVGGRTFELDARPSDAVALALGSRAPIFVACSVLENSAIPHATLRNPSPPPKSELQIEGCPSKPKPNTPLKTTAAGI